MKDKILFNRTILAIGISAITMVAGFWISYLLFQIVMS